MGWGLDEGGALVPSSIGRILRRCICMGRRRCSPATSSNNHLPSRIHTPPQLTASSFRTSPVPCSAVSLRVHIRGRVSRFNPHENHSHLPRHTTRRAVLAALSGGWGHHLSAAASLTLPPLARRHPAVLGCQPPCSITATITTRVSLSTLKTTTNPPRDNPTITTHHHLLHPTTTLPLP